MGQKSLDPQSQPTPTSQMCSNNESDTKAKYYYLAAVGEAVVILTLLALVIIFFIWFKVRKINHPNGKESMYVQ